MADNVFSYVNAIVNLSTHRVCLLTSFGNIPDELDLARFDVIAVHFTLVISNDLYVSPKMRKRIAKSSALKAIFIQDEYRFVDRTVSALEEIGADILFTCVADEEVEKVYPRNKLPQLTKINVLTGYVDEELFKFAPPLIKDREIDIGYRSRRVPEWLGRLGQEKVNIGKLVEKDCRKYGLISDISNREEGRLYGQNWINFLMETKATLGVESGSSVFDFTGEIQREVENHIMKDLDVSFDALSNKFFKDQEGLIKLNQISPRCFEAAALKCLMILYEGEYSGRLIPWRHFVPLKKDHSNMDEVVSVLRDWTKCQEIVDRTFYEVAQSYDNSFSSLVAIFDKALCEKFESLENVPVIAKYSELELSQVTRKNLNWRLNKVKQRLFFATYQFVLGRLLRNLDDEKHWRVKLTFVKYVRPIYRLSRKVVLFLTTIK
ncbi:hypothetical protein OAD74_07710 [Alphaproteobacteria bacterium]|nr:hypothetical protein [Alphaproteobacteria bacterium]